MAWELYLDMNEHPVMHSYLAFETAEMFPCRIKRPRAVRFSTAAVTSSTTPSEKAVMSVCWARELASWAHYVTVHSCILWFGNTELFYSFFRVIPRRLKIYVPTFRNILSVPSSRVVWTRRLGQDSSPSSLLPIGSGFCWATPLPV